MTTAKEPVPLLPPLDGSIPILPDFIDFQAEHNGARPCVVWPTAGSPTGTRALTFAEFSDASHRLAHILRPGRTGKDGESIGVLIHTDVLLYMAVLAGMFRAGLIVCSTSLPGKSWKYSFIGILVSPYRYQLGTLLLR